jgi:hypothetical protein
MQREKIALQTSTNAISPLPFLKAVRVIAFEIGMFSLQAGRLLFSIEIVKLGVKELRVDVEKIQP